MMLLILDQPFGSAEKQGGGITEASIAVWQSASYLIRYSGMEAWIKTDAARIPARLPAFAHSFDEFIREQILNILWKDETDQLPAPH